MRDDAPSLCVYFVGIGEFFDPFDMTRESRVIDVNLTGMVKTAAAVVPQMIGKGQGHYQRGLEFSDELPSAEALCLFRSSKQESRWRLWKTRAKISRSDQPHVGEPPA